MDETVRQLLSPFPLLRRLAHAASWATIGTLVGGGLSFLAMIAVARILGREAFGKLGILQSTVLMFQCFAGTSLGLTAAKHVAEYRASSPERAGHIIAISDLIAVIVGGIAASLIYTCAPWLAMHALAHPDIAPLLRIASVTIALSSLTGAMTGTLSGMEEFPSIALANLIGGLAVFPLILAGVHWWGITGVVTALAAQAAISCLLICWIARRKAKEHGIVISLRGAREWDVLWRFSLPVLLNSFIMTPVEWSCNSFLVRNRGYAEMGLYSAALQWRNLLMFLPIMLTQAALPVFSSVKGKHGESSAEFKRLIVLGQNAVVIVGLPLAVLCMFLSSVTLSLYGKGFAGGDWVFAGVIFMVMTTIAEVGLTPAIDSWGKMWIVMWLNVAWGIVFFLLARLTIPLWGASALGLSEALAYSLLTTAYLYFYREFIPAGVTGRVFASMGTAVIILLVYMLLPVKAHAWTALPISVLTLLFVIRYVSDGELVKSSLKNFWPGMEL
jgi:O-antigen/teichoic acid export membrane protein